MGQTWSGGGGNLQWENVKNTLEMGVKDVEFSTQNECKTQDIHSYV